RPVRAKILIPQTTPGGHRPPDRESGHLLQVFCESRRRVRAGVVVQHSDWPRTGRAGFCSLAPACHRARNPGRSGHCRVARRNHCGRTSDCSEIQTRRPSERPILKSTVHSSVTQLRPRPAVDSQSYKKERAPRWNYARDTAAFARPEQAHRFPDPRTKMLLRTSLVALPLLHPTPQRDPAPLTRVRSARPTVWPRTHSLALHTKQSVARPYARRRERPSHGNLSNLVAPDPWRSVVDTRRNRPRRNRRIDSANARRA